MPHISYFKGSKGVRGVDYEQQVAHSDEKDKRLSEGWCLSYLDLGDMSQELPEQVPSADSGFGEVGSLKWHALKINELETKEAVESYVLELTGKDIDRRGKLPKIKQKGIEAVEEWLQQET